MKYTLKNKKLYEMLDKEQRNFADHFDNACEAAFMAGNGVVNVHLVFTPDQIDRLEYSPTEWNVWPLVTPPEGVYMRCKLRNGARFVAQFAEKEWHFAKNMYIAPSETVLFKPFDD